LVEKFPTVLEKLPQVLGGDFLTHTVQQLLQLQVHHQQGQNCLQAGNGLHHMLLPPNYLHCYKHSPMVSMPVYQGCDELSRVIHALQRGIGVTAYSYDN